MYTYYNNIINLKTRWYYVYYKMRTIGSKKDVGACKRLKM